MLSDHPRLAAAGPKTLVEIFGPRGHCTEPQSLSREITFERDLHARGDRAALTQMLIDLPKRSSVELGAQGLLHKYARTVDIKLRYEDFRTLI